MRQPTEPSVVKEPLLVKLFAGYLLKPGEMAEEMRRERERHREQLAGYLQIEKEHFFNLETLSKEHQFGYFTLRSGIYYERGWLKWADEVISLLQLNS